MIFLDVETHAVQFRRHVQPRPLTVVRQKFEGNAFFQQMLHELLCAWNRFIPPVDHPIHVDQKSSTHKNWFLLCSMFHQDESYLTIDGRFDRSA